MINKKFNNHYKVKWTSDMSKPYEYESFFDYSYSGPLAERFKFVCYTIINDIKSKGNIVEVDKTNMLDGAWIVERLPNGLIINRHLVWIEKTD